MSARRAHSVKPHIDARIYIGAWAEALLQPSCFPSQRVRWKLSPVAVQSRTDNVGVILCPWHECSPASCECVARPSLSREVSFRLVEPVLTDLDATRRCLCWYGNVNFTFPATIMDIRTNHRPSRGSSNPVKAGCCF